MPLRNPVAPEVLRAFETVPDLYLILSADLIILTASDAYLKATLTEREAIVGKPLFEAFPDNPQTPQADGTSNLNASLEQALSTRTPHRMALQRYDVPRPASSGGGFEEKYWSPLNTPVLNGEGEVAYLIHRVEDVTESVKAQAHLKTLREQQTLDQEQIAGQRNLLEALIEQAPVGIGFFEGPRQLVSRANPLICAMWGHAPEAVLNRPLLEGVPELEGQGFDVLIGEVFTTGVPWVGRETPARLLRNGKPETSYYNFVFQPVYDGQGRITGVLDVVTEVTDLVTARRQVQQLNGELVAANGELQAANEEILATNEELTATNEELKATIEELHLAKEALEEINTDLEARVRERTRQVEAAIAEARAQRAELQRIFEQAPVAIATYRGPHLIIESANQAIGRLWGRPVAPLLGRPLFEALPDARGQGFEELFADLFSSGVARSFLETPVTMVQKPGGEPTPGYYNFTYQPLPETPGQPAGLIAVGIDVTGQVLARQEAEALQAELLAAARRQSQEREAFHQIFEQTPALIALLRNPGHRFQYVNPAYQRLFAGRRLVGLDMAEAVPEVREQGFVALLDQVYRTGETYFGNEHRFVVPAHQGHPSREAYFDFTYQAYRENGQTAGISIFAYEVTEQVLARQKVQQLNGELAAINEELAAANEEIQASNEELAGSNGQLLRTNADLDNFIYTASHDLKAPISNIEGLLQALLRSLSPQSLASERVQAITGMMQASVERFRKTIASLTEIVRLQKENSQPATEVNLPEVIREVLLDLEPVIGTTGARVDTDVTSCPAVRFSEKNLRSVIYNLVSNAVKYRSPERPPRVRIDCRTTPDCHVLTVTDNGLGLTAGQLEKLFTIFKRFHAHVEGSGIGLYMIRKMVENAGGRIQVESRVDEGTVFSVFFPR